MPAAPPRIFLDALDGFADIEQPLAALFFLTRIQVAAAAFFQAVS